MKLRGWQESARATVEDLVPEAVAAGASAVIVTDISRDGRLGGPDTKGLASLVGATGAPVIASGGISSLADLRELAGVPGLHGVIVGKAIYEGRVEIGEALAALADGP